MVDFTEESTLKEVLELARAEEILAKYNLPCLKCPMMQMEMDHLTLKDVCAAYRINIKDLLIDLNLATREAGA